MTDSTPTPPSTTADVRSHIVQVRGRNVLLDIDAAPLYEIEVRALMQAVRRNPTRFPDDFMFQLTAAEFAALTSQSVISKIESNSGRGGRRSPPHAFTEQGIAMLSSVLRSERAVLVNVAIMRAFVQLRRTLDSTLELAHKVEELERRMAATDAYRDAQIAHIIDTIRQMIHPERPPRPPVGFRYGDE